MTNGPPGMPGGSGPRLRLRDPTPALLGLPWERPLEDWSGDRLDFRRLPVGPSRHLVRFLVVEGALVALKQEPAVVAEREYEVLRHLEEEGLPAVRAVGLAQDGTTESAILATWFLPSSLQYRRLLMRVPPGPSVARDRLLDAMAGLLVDLHRGGIYWGDCSLANTLFRRDGDRIQAYLVDAETSEVHPALSKGQRRYDLDVLVENVAFGLADLAAYQGRPDLLDEAVGAAEDVRERYLALWDELHAVEELRADDRFAVAARIRRLNDLGFAVDEIELLPGPGGRLRLRAAVTTRRFHAHELERRTGLSALEGQAVLLLNDLREYQTWLEGSEGRVMTPDEGARRWRAEVLEPTLERLRPVLAADHDPLQAYCDVLETKWLRSEQRGRDIGLKRAIDEYLTQGALAPEAAADEADDDEADEDEAADGPGTGRPSPKAPAWTGRPPPTRSPRGRSRRAGDARRVGSVPSSPQGRPGSRAR
jgi:hypothetical protein